MDKFQIPLVVKITYTDLNVNPNDVLGKGGFGTVTRGRIIPQSLLRVLTCADMTIEAMLKKYLL